MGKIQLILGPMFSGKTTELIRRLCVQRAADRRCIVLKPDRDSRYSKAHITTHDRVKLEALSVARLFDAEYEARDVSVIGIDEAQFFPDVVPFCEKMANAGKLVIVAALDGTFERKPFGRVLELVPLAEDVAKLAAVCAMCHESASFSGRTQPDITSVEFIGGSEAYQALCRSCYRCFVNKILQ